MIHLQDITTLHGLGGVGLIRQLKTIDGSTRIAPKADPVSRVPT